MKSNFRVWFIALLGMFVFGITDAYAGGSIYSRARAFLKEGSPTAAGKVYVSSSSSTPAASSYKNCTSSTTAASSAEVKGASTTTTYHFWATANAGYKFTGWYSKNASGVYTLVSSNAHYSVGVTTGSAPSSGTEYVDKDLYAEFIKLVQLSFIAPTNGSYTITHKGAAVADYASFTVDGPVKLTATPAPGYKLRGWYTSTNGGVTKSYFAFGNTCEPNFTANKTVGADFVLDDGKATFWPKGSSSVYDDLNAAVTATSDGGIMVVVSDGTLPAGNYTINKNITLLLPYSTTNAKMTEPNIVHVTAAGSAPALSAYRKLSLAPGANITVASGASICLGGSIASVNGGNNSSFPCGPSGILDLSQGGEVTLNSGATLYAWGFVQGQNMDQGNNTSGVGRIIAKSGSTVWEDYQVGDWRGGTASSSIYSSRSSWKFFPFQSWTIQNIEAPIEFQKGANGKGFWTIFGDGQVFTVKFDYLASSGSLFTLNEAGSTLEKWYDPTTDKVCYQLGGGATTLDAMTLTAMGTTITTNDYNLPVPCNMSILLKSGTFTVSKPVVMHAGANMEVKSGATFNVSTSVYMFDQSEWGKYCMYYGGSDVYFQEFNTMTKHYTRGARTEKTNLTDAAIEVNGTMVVTSSGKLYSTASGCQVTGNNGGVVRFAGSLPSSTSIIMCSNLKNTNSVSMANVNLQNEDQTFTKSKGSSYFDNVNGRWFIRSAKNAKSDHTWDFTYIKSGAKNGTGGTDATVSAVYSNDRTGDVDRMKWFNVTADECDDWWVGPSSYLYNWTLNDAWHQFIPVSGMANHYSGSDGKLYQKSGCDWTEPSIPYEGCLYTIDAVQKALVDGAFVQVVANDPNDHAWHKSGAASTYYICLPGCVWKAATRIAEYSQAYTTTRDSKQYIWYEDKWLEATEDAPFFCARIDNKLKYFEWNGSAWTLMEPVAEVTKKGTTAEYIRFSDVMNAIDSATANTTVRLLKNINLTSGVTYTNNKQVTFNLNGYTISGAVNNLLTVNNASAIFIVIDGSTGGTGKIDMTFSKSDGRSTAINMVAGRLILNSGKIHAENTHASQPTCAIELANGTTFTQNGGRVEAASAGDTWGIHTASGSTTAQVNINGGVDSVSTTARELVVSAIMSEGGKVNMNGGTIKVSAIDSKNYNGGTAGIRLNHVYSRLAMNGGTIIANAKAYARGIFITSTSAKDTINGGVIRSVADSVCAYGIQTYGQTIVNDIDMDVTCKRWGTYGISNTTDGSKLWVNGGRFNIHNTAGDRVVGVYSDNGNDTINGGEFTITSFNKEAYGFYFKKTIASFVVNGGKFKVTGKNGTDTTSTYAAIWAEDSITGTKFKIAGGYYNMTSNLGARTADGKGVFELDPEVEGALIADGYIRKVRGVEYTITWMNRGGKEILATTKVEHGKVPVYPGETPTYSSSSGALRFIGWNTSDRASGVISLPTATSNATYYATYEDIYAEVIADGVSTQYTNYSSAWTAAMAKQQATIRLLRNRLNVNILNFTPSNANSIITLDLNGYAWGQDGSNHSGISSVINASPSQANCKLIITDNSASGKGYIYAGWAKDSELMAMYVSNCEVVMEGGTIKCENSHADGKNAIGVKVHSSGKFTMLGGTIEAEIPESVTVPDKDSYYSYYAYGVYNEGFVDLDSCAIKATNKSTGGTNVVPGVRGVSIVANSKMARLGKVNMQVQGNNNCYAVYAADTVQIDGGRYSVKVTSGNGAYGVYSDANAMVTINDGIFNDTLSYAEGTNCYAVYVGANGTVNINGGTFNAIPTKSDDWNNNCIRIIGLNSKLNITGGTFHTNSLFALRSFCGTTEISGNPVFTSQRGIDVGSYATEEGTHTAKVTIDGGTFVATEPYAVLRSNTSTRTSNNKTYTVNGDLEVFDGKFFSSTLPVNSGDSKPYLKIKGGYFSTYTSDNVSNLTKFVEEPSETEAYSVTIDGRNYTYRVKAYHAITWNNGTSEIRTDNVLRNEMPSFGEEVPSHPSPGTATYDFAGWQNLVTGDTVVKATENVTYTAQWRKIEAEVIEGEAAGVRFEHFEDAFDYAKDLSNATVKVLSDVTMDAPIRMDTATTITLDLNGHTLEYTGGAAIVMDSVSTLIITDSRTGGKIWTHSATPEWLYCAEINKGVLRLEGGELYARNTKTSNGKARTVLVHDNTTFTMTGGTLHAVSTIDARGVMNSGANGTVNISGGTVIANTYISETYGAQAYGIYLSSGEAHISGNPTFTVDANTYAYGVYIDGTGTTVDVDGNSTFAVTTHGSETNSYAYGFRVGASCALSVNGGTFTIRVPGGKKECYGVNVAGTVNIAGGTFDVNDQTSGGDNIDVIRATAATSVVNITGGTFNSRYNGMRAMGGTTTISGNPIFNNSQCVLAAYYSGVNGTAYVTIYGGTFNATSNYPINASWRSPSAGVVANSDIKVYGGYFKGSGSYTAWKEVNGTGTATLTLYGGYYKSRTIRHSSGDTRDYRWDADGHNYLGTGTTAEDVPNPSDEYTTGYRYQLKTNYTITWVYGDSSKDEIYLSGSMPSKALTTYTSGGKTYYFTGWSPEIAVVSGNATYTAQGIAYEAEVIVGLDTTRYEAFGEAWDYALAQTTATVRLLNPIATSAQINYAPTVENGRHTLDLNNCTLSHTGTSKNFLVLNRQDAQLTITDNSVAKGGKVAHNPAGGLDGVMQAVTLSSGELILENGEIFVQNTYAGKNARGVNVGAGTTFTMNNGTIRAIAKTNARGISTGSACTINITGGHIIASTETPAETWGATAYGIILWGNGTANISGSPTFDIDAASDAVGICTSGEPTTATITGGTYNIHSHTGNTATGFLAQNNSTITIEGVTVNTHSSAQSPFAANANEGQITINGGDFTIRTDDGSVYNLDILRVTSAGVLNVTGGTFRTHGTYSGGYAIRAFGGTTHISGNPVFSAKGGISAADYCSDSGSEIWTSTVVVDGGTFNTGDGYTLNVAWASGDGGNLASSDVTINGGHFMSTSGNMCYKRTNGAGTATLTINGGYFNETSASTIKNQLSNYLGIAKWVIDLEEEDPEYEAGYRYTIDENMAVKVVVGAEETYYASVKQALEYAKAQANPTIVLLKNAELTEAYTLNPSIANWRGTLDLNNFTLIGTPSPSDKRFFTKQRADAVFTITDNSEEKEGVLNLTGDIDSWLLGIVIDAGELVLAGGTIHVENTHSGQNIEGINIQSAGTFTQTGGKLEVTSPSSPIGVDIIGSATVSGGEIKVTTAGSSAKAFYMKTNAASILAVSGGTFNVSGGNNSYGIYQDIAGATATISGGTFNVSGENNSYGIYQNANGATATISGSPEFDVRTTAATAYGIRTFGSGSTVVIGGTPTISATAGTSTTSCVIAASSGHATINGGTFNGYAAGDAPYVVYANGGRVDITGGEFMLRTNTGTSNIDITRVDHNSTLNISGGIFGTDTTYEKGSAIRAFGGTTTISGTPTFAAYQGVLAADYFGAVSENREATVTINGGTFNVRNSAIQASWYKSSKGDYYLTSDITVNGGKFKTTGSVLIHKRADGDASSSIVVTGGYFQKNTTNLASYVTAPKHVFQMEAAECTAVSMPANSYKVVSAYTLSWATDGDGLTGSYSSGLTPVGDAITAPNTPTKTGYTFNGWDPAFTGTMPANDVTYTATWTAAEASVSIDEGTPAYYATLAEAFTAAKAGNNAVITLLQDVALTDAYTLNPTVANWRGTLDLNNFTLTGTTTTDRFFTKQIADAVFTITDKSVEKGGKMNFTGDRNGYLMGIVIDGGELVLAGGTIHAENTHASQNVEGVDIPNANGRFTQTGGKLEVTSPSSPVGVNVKKGNASVSGGKIKVSTAGSNAIAIQAYSSEASVEISGTDTISATAGVQSAYCVFVQTSAHATIDGGSFTSHAGGAAPIVVFADGGRIDITGGEFVSQTDDTKANNLDITRVNHNSTLNISGGTFRTDAEYNGGSAIRAFGGTVTISGTPTFTACQGVLAASWYGGNENRTATVTINGGTFDVRNQAIFAGWYKNGDYYLTSDITINGGKFKTTGSELIYKTADGDASSTLSITGGYYSNNNTSLASYVTDNHALVALTAAEKAVIGSDYNWQVLEQYSASSKMDIVDYSATSVTLNMNGYTSAASQADWKILAYGNTYTKTNRELDRTLVVDISSASLSADDTIRIDGTASDGTTVESHYLYIMPHIFTENTTLNPASVKATSVLYVKSDTLTIDADARVNKVYVCADAMLVINSGKTLTVDTLILRTKPFHSAELLNNGTLSATKVYYTRQIANKSTYYEIALPYDVTLANVRFSNGKPATYGSHYGLMEYSGQSRANNGPNTSLNWQTLNPASVTTMSGKKAYEMISASAYYYEFYFPVTYSKRADGETVAVTAYARAEGETPKGDKGWNYITTPYTHAFECDYGESPEDGLKIAWRAEDNTSFNQDVATAIKPTQAFYYQTETTGSLVFSYTNFHFAAMPRRAAQRLSTQWIRLHYGAEGAPSDVANIYLNDEKFTSAYETGYDVAKWSLDGGKPLIWTVVGDNKLAFAALPDSAAANSIPVTVFNPTEGAFTFSLELNRYMKRLEHVYLWDTYTNTTVDLMEEDYTETLGAGTIEGRFFLYTRNVPAVTTDIDLINGGAADADSAQPRKVIIEDKVFIIRGEHVYSIDGQLVK